MTIARWASSRRSTWLRCSPGCRRRRFASRSRIGAGAFRRQRSARLLGNAPETVSGPRRRRSARDDPLLNTRHVGFARRTSLKYAPTSERPRHLARQRRSPTSRLSGGDARHQGHAAALGPARSPRTGNSSRSARRGRVCGRLWPRVGGARQCAVRLGAEFRAPPRSGAGLWSRQRSVCSAPSPAVTCLATIAGNGLPEAARTIRAWTCCSVPRI
jgi:hypothetical protein